MKIGIYVFRDDEGWRAEDDFGFSAVAGAETYSEAAAESRGVVLCALGNYNPPPHRVEFRTFGVCVTCETTVPNNCTQCARCADGDGP